MVNTFQAPEIRFLSVCANDLVDWWGSRVDQDGRRVVRADGKHWFVKYKVFAKEAKCDRLAYLLGRSWTNVAEVRPVSDGEFGELQQLGIAFPDQTSSAQTVLVRLGHDYDLGELPHADLDAAVASELLFSLWIRRRDTHACNRVYQHRVPIFFDHQTAFLGEPELLDPDVFFRPLGNAGYAANWRVEVARSPDALTTAAARQIGRLRDVALHFVRDVGRFNRFLEQALERLQRQDAGEWPAAARAAGFSETRSQEIAAFLSQTRAQLGGAVERMRSVVFSRTLGRFRLAREPVVRFRSWPGTRSQ